MWEEEEQFWETQTDPLKSFLLHLKVVRIEGFTDCLNEVSLTQFLLKHGTALQELTLFTNKTNHRDSFRRREIKSKIMAFSRASSDVKIQYYYWDLRETLLTFSWSSSKTPTIFFSFSFSHTLTLLSDYIKNNIWVHLAVCPPYSRKNWKLLKKVGIWWIVVGQTIGAKRYNREVCWWTILFDQEPKVDILGWSNWFMEAAWLMTMASSMSFWKFPF